MKRCPLSRLEDLFAALAESYKLYIPTDGEKGSSFTLWSEGAEISRRLNTARPPKDFFFPQSEDLMGFKTHGQTVELVDLRTEKEDFALFGVRACDAESLNILDRVFLSEPGDSYYASRREKGVIFTLACNKPAETCFCTAFGIDPSRPGGDVSCIECGEYLYLEPLTQKGEAALERLSAVTEDCDSAEAEPQREKIAKTVSRLPLADLSTEGFGEGKTDELFSDERWAELSRCCIGCGSCTFVCPTCQCYDIKDFKNGSGVVRYRCWDSCMYSDFTKMSAGQPRTDQTSRFRQRFMHKLVYFPENNDGVFGCVGCGRCVAKCPVSMNIVKVMRTLGGKKDE